jgi:uncharacterized protein YecE (DUF72 family)
VGPFYPPGTQPSSFLRVYSTVFDTVEVDSSFYRVPSPSMVAAWRRSTPDDFLFTAKLPKRITHELRLRRVEEPLERFYSSFRELGPKLGAVVVQLPPSFKHDSDLAALEAFLGLVTDSYRHAVEFRHRSWFREDVYSLLEAYNVGLAWAETQYLKPPSRLTADIIYLRMVGDRSIREFSEVQRDRSEEMMGWLGRIRAAGGEVSRAYVFFNNHYAGFGPGSVNEFRRLAGLMAREFPRGGQRTLAEF